MPEAGDSAIYQRPLELLQNLIRFDTTNPPGNEAECVAYVNKLLTSAGFETTILAKVPSRPNLVARLKGRGAAPPLLLYGHVDVVTTADQKWTYPPFEARVADGWIWGRGAQDMKGGVAMMLAAFLRARAEDLTPAGDVVLAILSDEEGGGDCGARYLVESHAQYFQGIRYAIGEFGGFSLHMARRVFYPIQVAEKQRCWMAACVRGPGGHGSLPLPGSAMAKLGRILVQLDTHPLPVHVTPAARLTIGTFASALPFPAGLVVRLLLNPVLAGTILGLLGERGRMLGALLRNTVNTTIVHGSEKINVIPSEVPFQLDGRLLPGFEPQDMIAELRQVIGNEVELQVFQHDPGPAAPDMGLFDTLGGILREADPRGVPVPMLLPAVTDACFFSRLGIQTYGFTPMKLPPDSSFMQAAHAADERIPVDAVDFGANAIYKLLQRYQAP